MGARGENVVTGLQSRRFSLAMAMRVISVRKCVLIRMGLIAPSGSAAPPRVTSVSKNTSTIRHVRRHATKRKLIRGTTKHGVVTYWVPAHLAHLQYLWIVPMRRRIARRRLVARTQNKPVTRKMNGGVHVGPPAPVRLASHIQKTQNRGTLHGTAPRSKKRPKNEAEGYMIKLDVFVYQRLIVYSIDLPVKL